MSLGLGKSRSVPVLKSSAEGGGNGLFAEVLAELRKFPASSSSRKGIVGILMCLLQKDRL